MKTFLDSGVLIAAWKRGEGHSHATAVIEDEQRTFISCENIRLELFPKPEFERRRAEIDFYNEIFKSVETIEPFSEELGNDAFALAKKYGLAAGDALNLASAIRQKADEFVTSELPGKPMFRVKEMRVRSIYEFQIR